MSYNPFLAALAALTCGRARAFYVETGLDHTRKTLFGIIMLCVAVFVLGGKFRLFCDRVFIPLVRSVWLRFSPPPLPVYDERKEFLPDPWDEVLSWAEPIRPMPVLQLVAVEESTIAGLLCPALDIPDEPIAVPPKRTKKSNASAKPKEAKPSTAKSTRSGKSKNGRKTAPKTKTT
jgi:hypothetical protein